MFDVTDVVFAEKAMKKQHMIMRMNELRRDIVMNATKITHLIKYGVNTKETKAFINELHLVQAYRKKVLRGIRDNMRGGIYYFVPTVHETVNRVFPHNQYCDVMYGGKQYVAFNQGRMVIFLPDAVRRERHDAIVFSDAFDDKPFDALLALVYSNKIEFIL